MRFFAVILLTILTTYTSKLQAQEYQKRINTGGQPFVRSTFTTLSDSGIAILAVNPMYISSTLSVPRFHIMKLNYQGAIVKEMQYTVQGLTYYQNDYPLSITEGENKSLVCAIGINKIDSLSQPTGALIFKVDEDLNMVWNRSIASIGTRNSSILTKAGSRYVTVVNYKLDSLSPAYDSYKGHGHIVTAFKEDGTTAFSKRMLTDSVTQPYIQGVTTNNANNVVITTVIGGSETPHWEKYGCFTEMDTNGNVLQCKKITNLVIQHVHQNAQGNYVVTGRSMYPGVDIIAMFDSQFNLMWAKEHASNVILFSFSPSFSYNNRIYTYNEFVMDGGVHPNIVTFDNNGLPLSSIIGADTSLMGSTQISDAGKFITVSSIYNPISNDIGVEMADSISGSANCPFLPICLPTYRNISLNVSNMAYSMNNFNSPATLQINAIPIQSAIEDYCNPAGAWDAYFDIADDSVCAGEPVDLLSAPTLLLGTSTWQISGPENYELYGRQILNHSFAVPGQYTIRHLHTILYCVDTFERTLIVDGEAPPTFVSTCDTVFKADVTTACNITWPDGSNGNFYLPPTNGAGQVQLSCGTCVSNHNINFSIVEPPILEPDTIEMCMGNAVMVSYQDSAYLHMAWADGYVGRQRFITQQGIYPVYITGTGCNGWDTLVVTNAMPDASFTPSKDTVCINEAFDVIAIPAANDDNSWWLVNGPGYAEAFAVKDLIGLQLPNSGSYNIFHRHLATGGCQDTLVKQIIVKGGEAPTSLTICDTVYATDISTRCNVSWYDGRTTPYYVTNPTESSITVGVNCDGCGELFTIALNKLPKPTLQEHQLDLCEDSRIVYTITDNKIQSAIWNDGIAGTTRYIDSGGLYLVLMSNGACSTIDSITVTTYDCNGCVVYIPNAFSPNGDNNNDVFTTYTNCPLIARYELQVYNRTGEKVFESTDVLNGWDGSYKGSNAPSGVYVYRMQLISNTSKGFDTKTYTGSFTLLK